MPENEQERLRRLREQQISARDPHIKTRQFQRNTAIKAKKYKRTLNPIHMWKELPHVYKGAIYGLLAGMLALLIVPYFWQSEWTLLLIGAGTLVLIIVGIMVGQALDHRDEIKDLIK